MILDYTEIIYAMVDEPHKVHALMRMVTDALIKAMHEFKKYMTDYSFTSFNWWTPRGAFLADDLQAVFNPEFYKEFAVPYNEAIAAEFGGLALHSCGRIMHNIDNVSATKGLMAFNTQDPLLAIAPIVRNRVVPIVGSFEIVVAPNHPECYRPHCKNGAEVAEKWWADFEKMTQVKGQRFYYECHALLSGRQPQEAYDRMVALGTQAMTNLKNVTLHEPTQ